MSTRTTSAATPSATSSPALASGHMLYDELVGGMTSQSGQRAALASPSPSQEAKPASKTNVTSGLTFESSSASTDLQRSLESKLQARTQSLGSTMYTMTWKLWTMPSGVSRFRLRASARRTSATESTLRPAGWPTPAASDYKGGYQGGRIRNGKLSTDRLDVCAQIATEGRSTDFGEELTGWLAATGSNVQLDPGLSRWLMGLPPEWCEHAPTETLSTAKRRPSSSQRIEMSEMDPLV